MHETKLKHPIDAKHEVFKVVFILLIGILAMMCLKGCNNGNTSSSGVFPFTTDRR